MNEIARIIAYLAAVAVGVLALVVGILQRDWELVALGLSLIGVGGVATSYTPTMLSKRGKYGEHSD